MLAMEFVEVLIKCGVYMNVDGSVGWGVVKGVVLGVGIGVVYEIDISFGDEFGKVF